MHSVNEMWRIYGLTQDSAASSQSFTYLGYRGTEPDPPGWEATPEPVISLYVRVIPQPEARLPAALRRQKAVSFRISCQLVQSYATLRWCIAKHGRVPLYGERVDRNCPPPPPPSTTTRALGGRGGLCPVMPPPPPRVDACALCGGCEVSGFCRRPLLTSPIWPHFRAN